MALNTVLGAKNIPEGGVRLSRSEALEFQKDLIKRWKSLSDIVFLKYGWAFSSLFTFASSTYITNVVRSLLNMGSHFKVVPYFITSGAPSVLAAYWTEKKVTESTLLMTVKCPLCLQLKFGLLHLLYSVAFPAVGGLAFHLPVVYYYNTLALPDISNDTKKGYVFIYKLLKSRISHFKMAAAFQIPIIFLLPYLQEKQLNNISNKLHSKNQEELE